MEAEGGQGVGGGSNVNRMRNRGPRRRVKRGNNAGEHRDIHGCVEKTVRYVKSFISRNENNIKSEPRMRRPASKLLSRLPLFRTFILFLFILYFLREQFPIFGQCFYKFL